MTREELEEYREKGYSYDQIAEVFGLSKKCIARYMRKYGLTKQRGITEIEKEQFLKLRQQGKSVKEIAKITGRSESGIYFFLKAAGHDNMVTENNSNDAEPESIVFTPVVVRYAEERKPQAVRCVAGGKVWWDVSDFWIPR